MEPGLYDIPVSTLPSSRISAPTWNTTAPLKNIPIDSNLAWLLFALCLAMSWVIYITYYNSRVIGYILTRVINRFVKQGYIKVGSLSVSVLSGKIMFRDVSYITEDCTYRAQDGWIIFRWWQPYHPKEISEDLSHYDTRLSLLLNGFELHVYNRSHLYSRLEHLFGLEPFIVNSGSEPYWQDSGGEGDTQSPTETVYPDPVSVESYVWRDLIPVVKAEISTGRIVFGNRLLPTTLSVNFEEAHIIYTTKPASSRLDNFTHITKCKAENFKVILAPSPKYTGLSDEPPRYMGEGFVVFQSNYVDLYYYQDEAGIVTGEPEMIELADGDIVVRSTSPLWGLDIKCGKGTDFSYGPWADRQREHLYKFFFPQDFQKLEVTRASQVGEKRFCESFDIRLSTLSEATIDILFSKEKETNAVHMNVGQGSYLEITIPMRITEDGYVSKINGQLLHLEASTSLQYRSLVESETLEFDVNIKYPQIWNDHQTWNCSLTGCKSTVHLIYAHKYFFHALMEDWASKSRPDILHFVPYTWHFSLILKEFELITVVNEYNWIDCSSQHQENTYIAVSGDHFELSFDLPFTEYLPLTVALKFWIQGESADMCMYLPEVNPNRDIILMLEKCSKLTSRNGSPAAATLDNPKKWRNMANISAGWVDCWSVPIVALSIKYIYHPSPPCGHSCLDLDITTPEKEEILLSPIRPNGSQTKKRKVYSPGSDFDPMTLDPDSVHLELEIGSSVLKLYGSLLSNLIHLKENYFGENQKFFEFDSPIITPNQVINYSNEIDNKEFDPRLYRPLEVTVSVTLHDIQGHIMKCCNDNDPPCPSLYLERFSFEMHKTYEETELQLLLSPLILSTVDTIVRPESHAHLKDGHIALSSLQVRGHAMFSGFERPLASETLEYAWLVEVLIGDITGRITIPQLYHTITGLELFVFQVQQADCDLQPPHAFKLCQHDLPQPNCSHTTASLVCPCPDDIKYRMTRLSVDALDICIVESGTAIEIEIFPLRLATCNLHGGDTLSGLSMLLQHVQFKQYAKITSNVVCSSVYSIVSHGVASQQNTSTELWLEVGGFSFGPIHIDAASSQLKKDEIVQQDKFLKTHDAKKRKLWFLWPPETISTYLPIIGKCGCVGGCSFFSSNRNGIHFFCMNSHLEDFLPVLARYQISLDNSYGYGESLLHKGHFVFDVPEHNSAPSAGYSPSHSENSFMATESSNAISRKKGPHDIIASKSSDIDAHFIPRGQSAFSESFLDDKMSISDHNKLMSENLDFLHGGDANISSLTREYRHNQMRCIKRQFSSPTHMSMPSSSSALSSFQVSMAQSAPVSGKHERKMILKSDDWKPSFDSSFHPSPVKEGSISPGVSQNRCGSRISLGTINNGRGECNGSRHSLANIAARSYSPRSVRRAASTESTHSTESYFSADEDHQIISTEDSGETAVSDESFVEEDKRHVVIKNGTNSVDRKVSTTRRSLHDIQETPSQQSSDSDLHATILQRTPSCGNHDPSDTNSVSSTSFLSAMSSQEDIALVDLHNQMDKPIIESPLLMSCYTAHMTQLQCHQWIQPPPLPQFMHQSGSHHSSPLIFYRTHSAWKPKFLPLTEGFTSIHMVDKNKVPGYRQKYFVQKSVSTHSDEEFQPGSFHADMKKENFATADNSAKNASKLILVIKLCGDVHFMISPLLVESLRSFIDVITPTLAQLHPLTIVNHLHLKCSQEVQKNNQLKKEKVMHLSQLRAQIIEKYKKRNLNSSVKNPEGSSENLGNNYEETRTNHISTLIKISKINVSIMQASIVEEVISFSALDNLKDLTCVSLLSICIDSTLIQLSHSCQAKKVIQTFTDYCNDVAQTKNNERSKKSKTDSLPTELLTVETSETQQEETILSASVTCIHCQLRRLRNNSSILKEAMLTVIPYHRSKVEFTFENNFYLGRQSSKQADRPDSYIDSDWNQYLDEEKMGFIMFECGLEDIGVKFVKRWGYNSLPCIDSEEKKSAPKISCDVRIPKKNYMPTEQPSPSRHSHKSSNYDEPWDTKVSFPSCVSECGSYGSSEDNKSEINVKNLKGDASSFIIELKTVWFNFAAPPRTPNTRKIDFTRLDWHLLSTATPSINAWLKPSDRLLVSARKMIRESGLRCAASMACLMAEALEVQSIHMPIKSKYLVFKISPLAKTLQEDPSCQLLMVLRRYLKQVNIDAVEENLIPEYIPTTNILHRGLVALSRQWKNVLYMPFLVEQNIRFRKNMRPLNLSFSAPKIDAVLSSNEDGDKLSFDECEVTDETTNLLIAEGGSLTVGQGQKVIPSHGTPPLKLYSSPETGSRTSSSGQEVTEEAVSSGSGPTKVQRKLPSYPPRTSRASVAFPLLGGPLDSPGRYAGGMNGKNNGFALQQYGVNGISKLKKSDSRHSLKSTTWSLSSVEPNLQSSVFGTPQKGFINGDIDQVDEDLYNWMARQQDYIHNTKKQKRIEHAQLDSKKSTFATENSFEDEVPKSVAAVNFAPLSTQLADAHVIFQPLLNSMDVPNQAHHTSFSAIFGPKISVSAAVEMLKIDIIESEYQSKIRNKKKTSRKQTNLHGKFFIDTSMDTPTFICDKFSLEMELRESFNQKAESYSNDILLNAPSIIIMPNNSKHSTVINFTIDINFVAQQVNMPLLRLLHQFSTMYENIKETRLELKANRPSSFKESIKNEKKGFSPSESQTGSYRLNSPKPPPAKFSTPTPTKSSSVGVSSLTAGIRRPHTLSQRLRASTKGYTNLQEMTSKEERSSSPLSFTLSESVAIDIPDNCSVPASEHTLIEEIKELHPRCWRTMFYLLDLYDTMPEPKTVNERCSAVTLAQDRKSVDVSDEYKGNGKYEPLKEQQADVDVPDNHNVTTAKSETNPSSTVPKDHLKGFGKAVIVRDWTPLVVFGVATVHKTRLLAMLSGLKLEGELNGFHSSLTHKEKVRGTTRKWSESSLSGQLGEAMVVVLEGVPPNQQTVVKMTVGKSQALYSSQNKKGKDRNSALLTIGPINIDIPQHPVVLHGMMTRSSRQLSTTLQELRATRQPLRSSRQIDEYSASAANHSPQPPWDTPQNRIPDHDHELIRPIIIQFSIILDSLTIGAAVLPSLRAQYQMGQVTSLGITGSKAKFTVDLPQHTLSFNTKIQPSEGNMPSSASVDLPLVHISAEYILDPTSTNNKLESFTDGVVLCKGSYLSALAEIGSFEHSLTTDLLNHLVLVQKVFMKEVNEVVQKMSGADKPVPLWGEQDKTTHIRPRRLLFSLLLRLKGIQITATTPTSSAVRLETGVVELQLSNRVQNMSSSCPYTGSYMKLFGKAQVDVNLALGQLIKNALFEEAEPEFQQFAYFKTRICMRNALQDEMISSHSEDKEAVLITLNRPLMYIQPIALDKAVLVWLNYKNAYEYWNEQRASLNKEVLTATQQVFERVPQISQLSSQALGTLFLQLTVDDMGICLPLNPYAGKKDGYKRNTSNKMYDTELKAAVVVTLESTRISACSCGSLVSKAKFTGLCIRFADDFETSLDDWKPDPTDSNIMNLCVVSEGTYEICSRTVAPQGLNNAKWILNVQWQMEGVDIHLDTNIGKQLSVLFKTLTAITGVEDECDGVDYPDVGIEDISRHGPSIQELVVTRKGSTFVDTLPPLFLDPSLDAKKRSRLIEKEMNEQAKIINDLRLLGASQSTIEQEVRRLHELETAVFNDFRRDVIKKLRRQSVKATSFKDKLGLGTRSAAGPLQSMSLFFPDTEENVETGVSEIVQNPSSKESSPSHTHTRTGSLDMSDLPNLTLPEKSVQRELSLDSVFTSSAAADLGYSETPTPSHTVENSGSYKLDQNSSPVDRTTSSESPASSSAEPTAENILKKDTYDKRIYDVHKTGHTTPGGASSGVSSFKQPPSEPNIDFELDVKVFFNSGKCVLHTKDYNKEEDFLKRSMRKERSFSGGGFDLSSPSHTKKRHGSGMRNNVSASRLRYVQTAPANQVADFTIFLIPGLDVKVHYNSKTVSGDSPITSSNGATMKYCSELDPSGYDCLSHRSSFLGVDQSQISSSTLKKVGTKKACLFAWVTLQSIPEEAVVSPHILDFLEQALEPIPIQLTKTAPVLESTKMEDEGASLVTPSQYAYASFPVDVIVYFRMQPSILRFSCLPISRVECILRLPSVDLVFSSKRAEDDLYATGIQDSSSFKPKSFLKDNSRQIFDSSSACQTAIGGLSMTGCLADFSLYIFHPYGGAKKAAGSKEKETSPLSTSERKDSLSLQVEFVKVNISRSRKINLAHVDMGLNSQKTGRSFDSGGALIRFSAICDIGSASFKYDMRRLTEILAFPKAWYRRSIARRMFLGDQSTGALYSDQEDSVETSSSSGTMSPSMAKADYIAFSAPVNMQTSNSGPTSTMTSDSVPFFVSSTKASNLPTSHTSKTFVPTEITKEAKSIRPLVGNQSYRDRLWLNLDRSVQESRRTPLDYGSPSKSGSSSYDESKDSVSSGHSSPLHSGRHSSAWETLVLFAVNLSRLNIHMNMGNVMGNTTWLTRDFKSQGRLSIGSSGHKNLFLSVGLEGSTLDSKGGIVGGTIELSHIDTCMHLKEDWGQEPDHTIAVKLGVLESRLDYMGTSVLMGRVSSLDITLKDEWRVSTVLNQDYLSSHPTKRPALIFVNGELSWDQLQLLISKSTTPDLIKMYSKLEEFFAQQFHSSKRVFSSLQPRLQRHSIKSRSRKSKTSEETEAKHHRHWQKVLSLVSGLQLSTMPSALPSMGTILGGTMDLHGYNISLACFHGINFRSKAWAIFSMRKPTISFATEAQDVVKDDGSIATHIVQNLSYALGHSSTETAQHSSMATICRISRNVLFPPQFRSMHEWFHYAFATSDLDDVSRFPVLDHDRDGAAADRRVSMPSKGPEFNHNMEIIFALPSMQLHLKTEHLQPAKPNSTGGSKPTVDCSFVTEFDDHIFVAVDAEAFFFLHDLITSYIKEKEIVSTFGKSHSPDSDRKLKMGDPTESLQKDWRSYQCHTWHLEPTVRLLSWAGKGIEPYGVDYILQKLGFAHARVTIPKWMQRGCMDPLDKILAVVMEKMISAVKDDKDDSNGSIKKL